MKGRSNVTSNKALAANAGHVVFDYAGRDLGNPRSEGTVSVSLLADSALCRGVRRAHVCRFRAGRTDSAQSEERRELTAIVAQQRSVIDSGYGKRAMAANNGTQALRKSRVIPVFRKALN